MGHVFLILTLAVTLLLLPYVTQAQAQTQDHGLNPNIAKACANAPHTTLCVDTLKAQPNSQSADVKALAFMIMNVTKAHAESISNWINQKMEGKDNGPNVDQGLNDCAELYSDAVTQLDEAMDAFFNKDGFQDMNTFISSAMSDADTCMDGLKDEKVVEVMGDKNQVFSHYCSNALAIINSYHKKV